MVSELRHYLPKDWLVSPCNKAVKLLAPSESSANFFLDEAIADLIGSAKRLETPLEISWNGCTNPLRISPRMTANSEPCEVKNQAKKLNSEGLQASLFGADYMRILEFLMEQRESGNIVIITSNITRDAYGQNITTDSPTAGRDMCHHTSDLLLPSRAFWSPLQFTGYNYRLSWRRDRDDYTRLNPKYQKLKDVLARDGIAPNFEYTLYRPDGAKCRYETTYFLCRDYCGDEVRIGVSRPQDWAVLESVATGASKEGDRDD